MDPRTLALEAIAKSVLYGAVQVAVGIAATHWFLMSTAAAQRMAPASAGIDRRLVRFAFWSAVLIVGALMLRALAHTAAAFGLADTLRGDTLRTVVVESRWGGMWQRQMLAAFLLLAAAAFMRWRPAAGWMLFSAATLAVSGVLTFLGHAAGSSSREWIHGLHIAASGAWIGTLAVLTALALSAPDHDSTTITPLMVSRFWMVATPAAIALFATGVIMGILYVQTARHLIDTPYGRVLMLKLAAVGAVGACGFANWRRSRNPATVSGRLMALELLFALVVVLITGVLTELEHP